MIIELLPIVIVAAGITIIVGVTIELVSEMSKQPAIFAEEYERCSKVKNACLAQCAYLMGQRRLHGDPYKSAGKNASMKRDAGE